MGLPAIISDIDGCFVSGDGNVSEDYYCALNSISELVRLGNVGRSPPMYLCSGRDLSYVLAVSRLIGLPHTRAIIEAGTLFLNLQTREVSFNPIVDETTKKIITRIMKRNVPRILSRHPGLSLCPGYLTCPTFERKPQLTLSMKVIGKEMIRKEIGDLIRKRIFRITYSTNSASIVPAGATKGSALRFLALEDEIDLSKSIGIGDSKADISFMRYTKYVGCPANADDHCMAFVREKHGRVSPYNLARGVYDIIRHFLNPHF